MKHRLIYMLAICLAAFGLSSCEEELTLQPISIQFAAAETGMDGNSAESVIQLSRAADNDIQVMVMVNSNGIAQNEVTSEPAMTDGIISVNIAKGQATGKITFTKAEGSNPDGSMDLEIANIPEDQGYLFGTQVKTKIMFKEILSEKGSLKLDGWMNEDDFFGKVVYVDMSNNKSTSIDRKSWNLGFYCGEKNRVILNTSYGSTGLATDKTNTSDVDLDYAETCADISLAPMMAFQDWKMEWVDDLKGDLDKTVFGEIGTSEANAKVFLICDEDTRTDEIGEPDRSIWFKVKVTAIEGGYHVEYGRVGDASTKTVDITKDPASSFIGLSLHTGDMVQLPADSKWDFMWGFAGAMSTMKIGDMFNFSMDVVVCNSIGGAETATVMVADHGEYKDFTLAKAKTLTLEKRADVLGTKWRDPFESGVLRDRFYVMKDPKGNWYKFQFTKVGMANDGGERGKPELEFELLK